MAPGTPATCAQPGLPRTHTGDAGSCLFAALLGLGRTRVVVNASCTCLDQAGEDLHVVLRADAIGITELPDVRGSRLLCQQMSLRQGRLRAIHRGRPLVRAVLCLEHLILQKHGYLLDLFDGGLASPRELFPRPYPIHSSEITDGRTHHGERTHMVEPEESRTPRTSDVR